MKQPIKQSGSDSNIFAAIHGKLTLNGKGGYIMKKPIVEHSSLLLPLIVLFIALFMATGCEKKSTLPTFIKVEYGGCNNQTEFPNSQKIEEEYQNDTIIFDFQDGILRIMVGINYTCCADFNAIQNITDNAISLIISDTTASPEDYCRCECYYVFNYYFTDLSQKSYQINVAIKSPDGSVIKQISETLNIN